ncbi:hypothetical protein THAOC_17801 [Thalassiosira oceanica]|uniref:Uncharacterized protein n=1 Tax=Thalassiosira oceanica TaxID=159749 RepID=K0STW5_THAOC|nr:hypothetical protein THAOC_17801 [Thalassiosira oceanica]|eukprot:EJK61667.1 hypothetical protein THAOC_17801 [Thalassiosira oceanica]
MYDLWEGAGGAADEPEAGGRSGAEDWPEVGGGPGPEGQALQRDETRTARATATAGGDAAGASPVDEGRMSSSPAAALVFPGEMTAAADAARARPPSSFEPRDGCEDREPRDYDFPRDDFATDRTTTTCQTTATGHSGAIRTVAHAARARAPPGNEMCVLSWRRGIGSARSLRSREHDADVVFQNIART